MPRLLIAALAGGCIGAISVALILLHGGSAPAAPPQPSGFITVAEARALTTPELSKSALSLLDGRVVEVEGVPPKGLPDQFDRSLTQLSLGLEPAPSGWPGVCEGKILMLGLDAGREPENQDERAPARLADVDMRTVYKITRHLDLNADDDFAAFREECARARPFGDSFFTATNERAALDAGLALQAAREGAAAAGRPFTVSCARDVACDDVPAMLASLDPSAILSVEEVDCPEGKGCYEIVVEFAKGAERWTRHLRATTFHRGVGRKGWGILRLERLVVQHEQPFPPAIVLNAS